MTPEMVGAPRPKIELTKYSGRKALQIKLDEIGIVIGPGQFTEFYEKFIRLTETRKTVTDQDLKTIAKSL